jgi:hypothetical protein
MGKDIKIFPLPEIDEMYDDANGIPREIFEEASVEVDIDDVSLVNSLNPEQRDTYERSWQLLTLIKVDSFSWKVLAALERLSYTDLC